MKTCPRCETENPSKANFCIKCGAALGDDILPDDILLKKKLEEASATIEVLKKSLTSAQQELEELHSDEHAQALQSQIDTKDKEIKKLHQRVSELSESLKQFKNSSGKKKGNWGWFFVILTLLASATSVFFINEHQKSESEERRLTGLYTSKVEENRELTNQIENLRTQTSEANLITEEIVSKFPMIINDIEIANTYYDGEVETDYGSTLYSYRTMYLQPRIKYKGFIDKSLNFMIKWYDNEGDLRAGSSSPFGYTQSVNRDIHTGDNQLTLSSWGNSNAGVYWERGTYRIEIWVGGICLKSKKIYIY